MPRSLEPLNQGFLCQENFNCKHKANSLITMKMDQFRLRLKSCIQTISISQYSSMLRQTANNNITLSGQINLTDASTSDKNKNRQIPIRDNQIIFSNISLMMLLAIYCLIQLFLLDIYKNSQEETFYNIQLFCILAGSISCTSLSFCQWLCLKSIINYKEQLILKVMYIALDLCLVDQFLENQQPWQLLLIAYVHMTQYRNIDSRFFEVLCYSLLYVFYNAESYRHKTFDIANMIYSTAYFVVFSIYNFIQHGLLNDMRDSILKLKHKFQQQKPFIHNLLSMLPQGILILDKQEKIIFSNQTVKSIFGCKKSFLLQYLKQLCIIQQEQQRQGQYQPEDNTNQGHSSQQMIPQTPASRNIIRFNQQIEFFRKQTSTFINNSEMLLFPNNNQKKIKKKQSQIFFNKHSLQARRVPPSLSEQQYSSSVTIEYIIHTLLKGNNANRKSEQTQGVPGKGDNVMINLFEQPDEVFCQTSKNIINNNKQPMYNPNYIVMDNMIKVRVEFRNTILQIKFINCNYAIEASKGSECNLEPIVIIMVEDISQELLFKSLQDNNLYKIKMLSSFSHELKTPLNCSINLLEQALELKELQKVQRTIQPALCSNKILHNIVNDILDYAQIEAGTFKLDLSFFSLKDLMAECRDLIQIQADIKGLTLNLEHDPLIPVRIASDQNRIRQVILNFLSNSLKFTHTGSITIQAALILPARQPYQIRLSVTDTGTGITKEDLADLNSRCQMHSILELQKQEFINQFKIKKIGFGLLISQNLACALAPEELIYHPIQIDSVPSGSTFSFVIQDLTLLSSPESVSEACEQMAGINRIQKDSLADLFPKLQSNNCLNNQQQQATFSMEEQLDSQKLQESPFQEPRNKKDVRIFNIQTKFIKQGVTLAEDLSQQRQAEEGQQQLNQEQQEHWAPKLQGLELHHSQQQQWQQQEFSLQQKQSSEEDQKEDILMARSPKAEDEPHGQFYIDVGGSDQRQRLQQEENIIKSEKEIPLLNPNRSKQRSFTLAQTKMNRLIEATCKHPTILICDDDQFNLLSLRTILENIGFAVDVANSGFEAISKVQKRIDSGLTTYSCCSCFHQLIFMDIDMPVKNGYQTTIEINAIYNKYIQQQQQQRQRQLRAPPIISCSAFVQGEYRQKALESGMKDFISKPVSREKLGEMIIKWIN